MSTWTAWMGGTVVAAVALVALSAGAAPRPNVVVIVTDDQGWADVGYNNPGHVYTPNMDRLAQAGVMLANHYVMPQCTPTRVAMFTGRYPGRFAEQPLRASNNRCFPVGTPTLATLLRDQGYGTFLAGKWHMGSRPADGPNHHGFDSSYGSLAGAVGMYDHRYRKGAYELAWHRDHEPIPGHENGEHATDLIVQEAERVIHGEHDRPFFLMLTFHAPHTPLDERGPFVDRPTQLDPDRPGRWLNEDEIPWFNDPEGLIQQESDPEKRLLLAAVHHLDHAVGRVVTALEESGQLEQTLVLFTSDNGPQGSWGGNAYPDDLKLTQFNQPLPTRGKKLDVWEGGIRVPGFFYWPGTLEPGRVDDPVHVVDWLPTVARLTGADVQGLPLDGVDLIPRLMEGAALAPRDLYWAWRSPPNRWALRHGPWKIVHYGADAPDSPEVWQLFNLSTDLGEKIDLAGQHPGVAARLHEMFVRQRSSDHAVR